MSPRKSGSKLVVKDQKMKNIASNKAEIVQILKKVPGLSVLDLSELEEGCPDLLIGYKGFNHLIEIKNSDSKESGTLQTERRKIFFDGWLGQIIIASDIDAILFAIISHDWEE